MLNACGEADRADVVADGDAAILEGLAVLATEMLDEDGDDCEGG